jgi:hypothetical protein
MMKKKKISKKIIYIIITILAITFFLGKKQTLWKTITFDGRFVVRIPKNWHAHQLDDGKILVITNSPSEVSTQDLSVGEKARVTIWRRRKDSSNNKQETLVKQTLSLARGKVVVNKELTIDGFPARYIEIDNASYKNAAFLREYHLFVDVGENIYEVFGGVSHEMSFLEVNYYLSLIEKIINNISFTTD